METNGIRVDVILVDAEKDKKLSKLKQYILALVKGLQTNPPAMIKKIAGLVSVSLVLLIFNINHNQYVIWNTIYFFSIACMILFTFVIFKDFNG